MKEQHPVKTSVVCLHPLEGRVRRGLPPQQLVEMSAPSPSRLKKRCTSKPQALVVNGSYYLSGFDASTRQALAKPGEQGRQAPVTQAQMHPSQVFCREILRRPAHQMLARLEFFCFNINGIVYLFPSLFFFSFCTQACHSLPRGIMT